MIDIEIFGSRCGTSEDIARSAAFSLDPDAEPARCLSLLNNTRVPPYSKKKQHNKWKRERFLCLVLCRVLRELLDKTDADAHSNSLLKTLLIRNLQIVFIKRFYLA